MSLWMCPPCAVTMCIVCSTQPAAGRHSLCYAQAMCLSGSPHCRTCTLLRSTWPLAVCPTYATDLLLSFALCCHMRRQSALTSKLPHRGTTQLPLATVCVNQLVHADSAAICCALFSHVQAIRLDPKAPLPHLGTAQVYLATGGDPTNSVSELGLVLNALPGRCCTTQQVVQVVLHSQLHSLVLYRHAGFTHTLSNLCMEVTHSLSDVLLVLLLQATLMCCGCWVGCCWCSLQ
jgi:hypothetical protein